MANLFAKLCQRLDPRPRIQILSDLHLEVGQQYSSFTFPATAPYLLLAGDIGRLTDYDAYRTFLEAQATRYRKVFLVLGNHEFYGLDYDSGLATAHRLAAESSLAAFLVLLHRARWDDPDSDVTILGCTLWSHIPDDAHGVVESKVNDFKKISCWTAQRHTHVHWDEVNWLREQIGQLRAGAAADGTKRRILVATHHAPCIEGTSRPEDTGNPWTVAFATDLLDRDRGKGGGVWEGVRVWVFGHTHYSSRLVRGGVRVVSNQRGYVLPGASSAQRKEKAVGGFEEGFAVAV